MLLAVLLAAAGGFAEETNAVPHYCDRCQQIINSSSVATNTVLLAPAPSVMSTAAATNSWKVTVYGSFAAKSGNTVEKSYKYGGEFAKKDDKVYRYKLKVDGKYGQTEKQVTDSKAEASGEMRRMLEERWFAYGTLSALHDDIKNLSYRVKAGPGLGYYFADTDALIADVSSGPLYVLEKTPDGDSGYLAWRLAQWFDWKITDTFRWWISTEAVLEAADIAAYTLAFKTGVDSKLNENLSLIVVLEDDYDSAPEKAGNIKKNDMEVSTGLRYHF